MVTSGSTEAVDPMAWSRSPWVGSTDVSDKSRVYFNTSNKSAGIVSGTAPRIVSGTAPRIVSGTIITTAKAAGSEPRSKDAINEVHCWDQVSIVHKYSTD